MGDRGIFGFWQVFGLGLPLGPLCPCGGVGWTGLPACLLPAQSQDPGTPYLALLDWYYGVPGPVSGGHARPGGAGVLSGAFEWVGMAGLGALGAALANDALGLALSGRWKTL